ncbi:aldo/keto reductase [Myxacorys almedinensis]|uniref:NADP-dependent oxidoreductase domain-containing protein n=1 Tax=Myxacorys almedinensis A TaxID=2690445 RepID=A0A8J7Z1E9_9CYAN|nr:aldo/keto reductase [Myxacorys almedinensis]NDJ17889.1 hypothetical protein [Myxacorys almedinensis A]
MNRREFGHTGIYLSPITFGSMRLAPDRVRLDLAVEMITRMAERGLTTFHSSHEYESYPFFCEVMQEFRSKKPSAEVVHIAKIAVPHFHDATFTGSRLSTLIEDQLRALGTERIDIVQWLVRHQPNEDEQRLTILAECQQALTATWERLHGEGKVGVLTSFPYSVPFAREVLKLPLCEGLVTYLNALELDMVPFLDAMEKAGQGYVAIRPFHAGLITTENMGQSSCGSFGVALCANRSNAQMEKLVSTLRILNVPEDTVTDFALQFPLLHPAVASVIVSVTSLNHADEVMDASDRAIVDKETFTKTINSLSPSLV